MFKPEIKKVEVSYKTIIFTVVFILSLIVLYKIRGVLVLVFIAFLLMTALNTFVEGMVRMKVPRTLAIIILFILVMVVFSSIVAGIIPPLVEQIGILINQLAKNYPDIKLFNFNFDEGNLVAEITKQLETIGKSVGNVFKVISSTASGILGFFSVMVLTVYFLIERKNLEMDLKAIFNNEKKEQRYKELFLRVEKRLGGWIRGEFFLMLIVGTLTYIGLVLLGIPFALPLAIIAGLLELIPNLGPTISSIPGILAGLTISLPIAIGTLILYIAVQQLENNLIVPLVMKKSADLNPIITMLALMVGATLGGIAGAILCVPLYVTVREIVSFWREE